MKVARVLFQVSVTSSPIRVIFRLEPFLVWLLWLLITPTLLLLSSMSVAPLHR